MGNRAIPAETKQTILEDAKGRILEGHTLTQIAELHGISKRTLNTWLASLGEEYRAIRQALWKPAKGRVRDDVMRAAQAAYQIKHREKIAKQQIDYYSKNKADLLEYKSQYYQENKERLNKVNSDWKVANADVCGAINARRAAAKLSATPAWADKDSLLAAYKAASRMSAETGVKYHVDHIVPLRSDVVCGLHCESNLQLLTAEENMAKSNRRWPDMP